MRSGDSLGIAKELVVKLVVVGGTGVVRVLVSIYMCAYPCRAFMPRW